jgi:hypothetical protein|tara:strand:- start:480 stop:761 length:282 start_codon:yes stop_codon:yes gene_type:complete
MGLAEALKQVPENKPTGPLCGVATLREQLTGEDLDAFNTAIEMVYSQPRGVRSEREHGATAVWLANTLTENGYTIHKSTLQRHIRGGCACGII